MSIEQKYQNYAYICGTRGLVALYANDRLPDHTYNDLTNLEVRQENALSMRFGHIPLTLTPDKTANAPLDGAVLSLGRLHGLTLSWRYAKTSNGTLYRGHGEMIALPWTAIDGGLNQTNRTSFVQTQTPFSSNPFMLIADSNMMLKDDGTERTSWGYPFPDRPASANPFYWFDDFIGRSYIPQRGVWFYNDQDYSYGNLGGHYWSTLLRATGTVESNNNECLVLNPVTNTTNLFVGLWDSQWGALFVEAADTTNNIAYCSPFLGDYPPPVGVSLNLFCNAVTVTTVVGNGQTGTVSSNGLFNPGWVVDWPSNTQGWAIRLQATVHDPTQIARIRINLSFNDASFTNYMFYDVPGADFTADKMATIVIPISSFTMIGTPNLSNIVSFRLDIVNSSIGGSTTIILFSLITWFIDNAFPSSLGGLPYDYRVAGYNSNTGSEGPSTQIVGYGSSVFHTPYVNQHPIIIYPPPVPGAGLTHFRIYRRGGTLSTAWYMVGQVPFTAAPGGVFVDTMSDPVAATQNQLAIDNYPPITSTLPTPINTTFAVAAHPSKPTTPSIIYASDMSQIDRGQLLDIGSGATSETVVVIDVGPQYFTAYLQYPHQVGEQIYGGARYQASANIAEAAFERIFVGGDPNNPGRLYYSALAQPESFPPENFIDLPGAAEVIMGMAFTSGLLFVGTLTGWHKVISVNGSTPIAVKTNARHGLFGVNALEIGEGVVTYLSYDGVYLFNGSNSTEFSEAVQWVFRSYLEAGGPIPVMDTSTAGRAAVNFGYDKSEAFVSYLSVDGVRQRVIYSQRDNRWRHDDISASAQNYEEDVATLIYGNDQGMVYMDRIGDQDIIGVEGAVPVTVRLATAALDQGAQKNPKVYQEFTIDINTRNQDVTVGLLLDNMSREVILGTVNTPVRQQVNLNVNEGLGLSSLNAAFLVKGTLTNNIDIFELHVKALVDAETRESFDTYWTKYGVQEWKLVKQGYFEYTATDPVTICAYIEGNVTTPKYCITLPPSPTRTIVWKRFPAVIAKLWRWVATSPGNFTMYESSHIEVKPVCGIKGYTRQPFAG